jgi:hypothetical protein
MICIAEYKDQLMPLRVIAGAPGLYAKALIDLKANLDEEKAARVIAQIEANVLSWAVWDLKVSANGFATQIPTPEDKVKNLEDNVVEGLNEVRARELCLRCTTRANDDYQKEVA